MQLERGLLKHLRMFLSNKKTKEDVVNNDTEKYLICNILFIVSPTYSATCKLFSVMMERSVVPSSIWWNLTNSMVYDKITKTKGKEAQYVWTQAL